LRGIGPLGGDDRIELREQPCLVRAHQVQELVIDRRRRLPFGHLVVVKGCRHDRHLLFEESPWVRR
jgi:hypothetical protein